MEVIDGLSTIWKSHSVRGRYYFGHTFNAYRSKLTTFIMMWQQSTTWIFPLKQSTHPHILQILPHILQIWPVVFIWPSASSTLANTQSFLSHPASQWIIVCFVNITGHSSKELFYAFDLHYKCKGLSSMGPGKAASIKRLWKLLPGESVEKEGKLFHNNYLYNCTTL